MQDRIGLRFINNRPFIKEQKSLEGYLAEGRMIGKENYISLDSLVRDNKCIYLLKKYPLKAISITSRN